MIRVAIALGALMGTGLVLIVSGLRSAPPRLDAALARLAGTDTLTAEATHADGEIRVIRRWLTDRLAPLPLVRIPSQDLAILGMTRERFIAEKAAGAAFGLCLPPLVSAVAAAGGLVLPWSLPAAGALVFAVAGFLVPDGAVRSAAARRRADFRHAFSAYIDLVRLAFGGGAGPSEALERAHRYSSGWAFQRIGEAVEAAGHARLTPWQGLARLGAQIGVDELADLADLADLAGVEGAKVADAITAYSTQMRARRLAEQRYQAGARTATMTVPIAGIGLAFIALLGFPQVYLLLTS